MEFNSQICTTEEQSKRLLALGLKKETADMRYQIQYLDWGGVLKECTPSLDPYPPLNNDRFIPAWSLHRLIEMCNKSQAEITIGIYCDEVTVNGDLFEVYDNTYDNLISIIEWLIGLGKFNKNYLDTHSSI